MAGIVLPRVRMDAPRDCCDEIARVAKITANFIGNVLHDLFEVIQRIVVAVKDFFVGIVKFIFNANYDNAFGPWGVVNHGVVDLVDTPVNLDALRAALRNGGNPAISRHMTVNDFLTLINEFPRQQVRIGAWATKWADARPLKIDPTHPYYEIAQVAIQLKDQLRGQHHSNDLTTYSCKEEGYYAGARFPYIIYSIMGFQELSRPETRDLLLKLDNKSGVYDKNPAFAFARALSKIYPYPKDGWRGEKLHLGVAVLGETYQLAKNNNQVLRFFQECFKGSYCYDARVTDFQNFSETIIVDPAFKDFNVDIIESYPANRKLLEHYRVFRNLQVKRYCDDQRGIFKPGYANVKATIDRGEESAHTRAVFQRYCTKDNFALYLQEKGQPVKENGEPIEREKCAEILPDDEGYWG